MEIYRDGLIVCHDCGCVLANGEGDDQSAEALEAWSAAHPVEDLVLACAEGDDCENHGWYRCEVCDVQTFGWGHSAVTFRREVAAH